jgi:hypothetical protein
MMVRIAVEPVCVTGANVGPGAAGVNSMTQIGRRVMTQPSGRDVNILIDLFGGVPVHSFA